MRRMIVSSLMLILFGVSTVLAEGDPKLEGKWILTSLLRDGKADESMKDAIREHKGDKYSLAPKEGKAVDGTIKIDASKSPKTMDMMPSEGRYKGKTLQGIYEIDGDTLKIAFAEPGKERPTAFESKPGSGVVLAIHKKEK
jgi:uncharacterized protein (TIGR03067 family)